MYIENEKNFTSEEGIKLMAVEVPMMILVYGHNGGNVTGGEVRVKIATKDGNFTSFPQLTFNATGLYHVILPNGTRYVVEIDSMLFGINVEVW